MTALMVKDEIVTRLEELASEENRSIEDILDSLLDLYVTLPKSSESSQKAAADEALLAMDGMIDVDITDLSTTVRETMKAYYQKKYGNPD
jgi:hypothetical protein